MPIRRAILTSSLRRAFVRAQRQPILPTLRLYSASLDPGEYHRVADETMDKLTGELETLLEDNDVAGSDVEYSVYTPGTSIHLYSRVAYWRLNWGNMGRMSSISNHQISRYGWVAQQGILSTSKFDLEAAQRGMIMRMENGSIRETNHRWRRCWKKSCRGFSRKIFNCQYCRMTSAVEMNA